MKLAEFFVALGFDIEGAPELKSLECSLNDLASNAAKLLGVFGSMTAGMAVMLNQTLNTGESLRRFSAITGLSTDELQSWKYAAEIAGVKGDELTSVIQNLQNARTDIMMGRGNVAPWQLLGIAPSANPFNTLRALKDRIKDLDPAIARNILSQMGISEGGFATLRRLIKGFDELEAKYKLTTKQQNNLTETNEAWTEMVAKINAVKDSIIASLVPALTPLIKGLIKIISLFASFAAWLAKDTAGAKTMRVVLLVIVGLIVGITAALTVLIGVLGLVTAAVALMAIPFAALFAVTWHFALIIGIVTGIIAALVLVIQDLWTSFNGGEGIFVKHIDGLKQLLDVIHGVIDGYKELGRMWDKMTMKKDKTATSIENVWSDDPQELKRLLELKAQNFDPGKALEQSAITPSNTNNNSSSVKQENNINITTQSGKDPYQTGKIIGGELQKALSNAAYQLPIPTT